MVSQLYVELDEFSNSLLVLRLEETAVGAGVAIADRPAGAAAARRPGRPGRRPPAAGGARRPHRPVPRPAGRPGQRGRLRPGAAGRGPPGRRRLPGAGGDGRPMRTPLFGALASRVAGFTATTDAARHYARNLLLDASTRCADAGRRRPPRSSPSAGRQLDGVDRRGHRGPGPEPAPPRRRRARRPVRALGIAVRAGRGRVPRPGAHPRGSRSLLPHDRPWAGPRHWPRAALPGVFPERGRRVHRAGSFASRGTGVPPSRAGPERHVTGPDAPGRTAAPPAPGLA